MGQTFQHQMGGVGVRRPLTFVPWPPRLPVALPVTLLICADEFCISEHMAFDR